MDTHQVGGREYAFSLSRIDVKFSYPIMQVIYAPSARYEESIAKIYLSAYNANSKIDGVKQMKIKLAVRDDIYPELEKLLAEKGFEIDNDADFILMQREKYISHITVRDPKTEEKIHLDVGEIIFIESFGHLVEIHTMNETYQSTDRLYHLASVLDSEKFLRVSNSVIIARHKVKQIKPAFSMKFVLIMQNDARVDVTRSYYNAFKEAFRI